MNRQHRTYLVAALCILSALVPARGEERAGINGREFRERRISLLHLLDSSSVLVMRAADEKERTNDAPYPYRQQSSFLYMTGMTEPGAILLLSRRGIAVEGKKAHVCLFPPAGEGDTLRWGEEGEVTVGMKRFRALFQEACRGIGTLYVSAPDLGFVTDWVNDRSLFLEKEMQREFEKQHPGATVRAAAPLVTRLREIKSPAEIACIRKAIALTREGLLRAWKECAPGKVERDLQAAFDDVIVRGGADGESFPSIIGSGENSLIPHYDRNVRRMRDGEVVVMDVGAEVAGYAADITRTVPVGGKYSKGQREVYETVRHVQRELFGTVRAGLPWRDIDRKAKDLISAAGYGKYVLHGVTHHVGLDVHDPASMDTLRSGMVITVEPGIYIPVNDANVRAEYRGLGIRIEDDVLVTGDGCQILSEDIPRDPGEIEKLMRK